MLTFLGLASLRWIDLRGFMARPLAEDILRRLLRPAPATPGTRRLRTRLEAADAAWNPEGKEAARRQLMARIQALRDAGMADGEIVQSWA